MKFLNTGEALLIQLKRSGITQTQLADRVGLKRQTIGNYVRNKTTMTIDVLFLVAKELGVSPYEFIKLAETLGEVEREVA